MTLQSVARASQRSDVPPVSSWSRLFFCARSPARLLADVQAGRQPAAERPGLSLAHRSAHAVYASNCFEGCLTTRAQTFALLQVPADSPLREGSGPGSPTPLDREWAVPHARALAAALTVTGPELTEATVLALHRTLLGGVLASAGAYRVGEACTDGLGGRPVQYAPAASVPGALRDLLAQARAWLAGESPLACDRVCYVAGYVMVMFLLVHPFEDGNGRLARILANCVLRLGGLGPLALTTTRLRKGARHYSQVLDRVQHRGANASLAGAYVLYCVADELGPVPNNDLAPLSSSLPCVTGGSREALA